jgi:HSP20 family protein
MAKKKKDSKKNLALSEVKKNKDSKKNLALSKARKTNKLPAVWFDEVLGPRSLPTWFSGENALWTPAIHVLEKDDKFVVKFELPGVNEEDLGISIIGGKLIVQGEKRAESEVKKKGYSYLETSYGSFSRSIMIPSIVDLEMISADFNKGVLEINLPKIVDIQPKKINVTANKVQKVTGKKTETVSSAGKINSPKIAASQPKKVNAPANKKATPIKMKPETVANANIKTDKSEGSTTAQPPIS